MDRRLLTIKGFNTIWGCNYSGPATVAEVPYMECFICKRKYHVEAEMRVAIIQGFLSSDSTRRNC